MDQAEQTPDAATARPWVRLVLMVLLLVAVVVVALRPSGVPAFRATGQPVDLPAVEGGRPRMAVATDVAQVGAP